MNDIKISKTGKTSRVTLNRPRSKNSISLAMWRELATVFRELSSDDSVRCVVLTGAAGHFSSGADVSEFEAVRSNAEQTCAYERAVDAAGDAILECTKPVIAAIEGYCIGGGLGLAMACDFRIAAPSACLFVPAAQFSIVYGLRETQTLLAPIGLSNAKRLLFTGERLSASEALRIGLVDEVTNELALDECISELAQKLEAAAPLTVAGAKEMLNHLCFATSADVAEKAKALVDAAGDSEDYREARIAFREKRRPNFRGV